MMHDMSLSFPTASPVYGLTPENPRITPALLNQATSVAFPLRVEGEILLDFGRKVMGQLWIACDAPVNAIYATDLEQLRFLEAGAQERDNHHGIHETYAQATPWHDISMSAVPIPLEDGPSVLRLLKLSADTSFTITACWLDFSAPHLPLDGSFECDDPELNRIWQMDVYTVLLCTQNNIDAVVPIPAPGKGYVIWDGSRRDREVWAGDLRPAALTWLSAYADPEPVRNSLYMLWQARHVGCEHTGMIPGSAGTHQTFYEWTFWFLVNAWEYYLYTGDRHFLRSLMAPGGLDFTLDWVKRNLNEHGLLEATNSWMYTLKLSGEMAALAIVQVAGLEALAKLLDAGERTELSEEARQLAQQTRTIIPERFYDQEEKALRMLVQNRPEAPRYPLDANAWAVLYGIGDETMRQGCLDFMDSDAMNVATGLRNYVPAFTEEDGDWYNFPETHWLHNETVWPYPNCYAVWAWMHQGNINKALDVLKAFHRPHIERGHATLWEGMLADGRHPVDVHGNMLSLCHAWGGTGAYLLQRYILGITPTAPGFTNIDINPNLGPLQYVKGSVPTPYGPIAVSLEKTNNGLSGEINVPQEIQIAHKPHTIQVRT